MRDSLTLRQALERALAHLGLTCPERTVVEPPKDPKHGDLATNAAMLLAGQAKRNPRELAQTVAEALLAQGTDLAAAQVAGPGFLNVTFAPAFWQRTLAHILEQTGAFGQLDMGRGVKVQVEYVSANPTGPLHIGHGRGAAVGDSLARILRCAGYEVQTEYYINDAGRQMRMLGESIHARYVQLFRPEAPFLEEGYKGEYIVDLAKEVRQLHGDSLLARPQAEAVDICFDHGMNAILQGIKDDLGHFRVGHDIWFSEKSLVASGEVEKTLEWLRQSGLAFEQEGALWLRTTQFGDDKDRVLRKSSGDLTYFASDIAYHANKFRTRAFDLVLDVWGADHHGYIPRMRAAVAAMGLAPEQFDVILIQLVTLLRGGEPVKMSTRAGEFDTLAEVVADVGVDAARFMFLSRKADSKLDFDLELVKAKTMDNPVYYVQYAHARICSVFAKAQETGVALPAGFDPALAPLLDTPEDLELLKTLERFPDAVRAAAANHSPHHVSFYLRELATSLHRYYTAHPILSAPTPQLVDARLMLMQGVAQVLRNGLELLGVSAPKRM